MILVKNDYIKPMEGADIENGCVLIDDKGKIAAVGAEIAAPAGAEVINAGGRLVTPGCVEAHSHIGLDVEGPRKEGADCNEKADPVCPHMRAVDAFYPQSEYLDAALRGGVTTACAGPGSADVVGGSFVAVKLVGSCVDDMIIRESVAMKAAFGENPRAAFGGNKKMPYTRMGVAAVLRELLIKTKAYQVSKDAGENPKFEMKLEAMLPVMRKEIPLKCHVHRADDILTAVRIAKEFDIRITLDHCTEGHIVVDKLAREGFPAIVGPSFGGKGKLELMNKTFCTAAVLHNAGVKICITTDSPVTPLHYLPLCAGLAASEGLPMEEAWKAITINPAEIMGISDWVGSLKPVKDGDLVIWTADPLTTVGGRAYTTVVDGKIVYQA